MIKKQPAYRYLIQKFDQKLTDTLLEKAINKLQYVEDPDSEPTGYDQDTEEEILNDVADLLHKYKESDIEAILKDSDLDWDKLTELLQLIV